MPFVPIKVCTCQRFLTVGHTCFVAGEGPWCGATVKLDVTLKAPVSIGDTLLVIGKVIEKVPSRGGKTKVKISAQLLAGDTTASAAPVVYAEMTGVSISGVRLPSCVPHDAVDERSWESVACAAADGISNVGEKHYRDTGWSL